MPFRAGELLTYDVSYSTYVTAGTVTMHVQAKRPSYNSVAYYVVAEARPTPLMSKLYTLYYKADVLMDVYTLLPQRAGVYSEEGQRHQMKVTTFNNATRKATFENVTAKSGKREFSVPAFTQDALSAIYVMRALPLKVGTKETIPVALRRAQLSCAGHRGRHRGAEDRGGTVSDIPAADGALRRRRRAERPPHSSVDQRYAQPRAGQAAIRADRRLVHPHAQRSQTRTVKRNRRFNELTNSGSAARLGVQDVGRAREDRAPASPERSRLPRLARSACRG